MQLAAPTVHTSVPFGAKYLIRLLLLPLACVWFTSLSWSQSAPVIHSFTVSQPVTNPGIVTNLSWSVSNATTLIIDQNVGDVTGTTSIYVSPVQTTTYTLTATAGSSTVTQQLTVQVQDTPPPPFGSGRTFYVSPSGNDSYNGLSPASAWLTVAKVNGTNLLPGDTVLFQRGGEWHESLTAPSSGVAGNPIGFADYGSGAKPKFWGSNVLSNSLFVPLGNGLYTYSIAKPVTAALVNHTFFLTTPSGNAADLAHSWSYSGTTLTINSPNSDPRVDGNVYTAVVRQDAIYSNYMSHLVFRNLVTDETAAANQGYGIRIQNSTDVLVDSCEAYRAAKHHIASINSTQFVGTNLYAAWSMPGQSRVGATSVDPGVSAYVAFGDSTSSLPNQTSVWRNCVWDHPVDPQNALNYYAFYTHGSNITSVLLDNMSSLASNLTVNNSDNPSAAITVKAGLIQNARLEAYGQNVLVDGTHLTGPNVSIHMGGTTSTFQNILLEGSYLEADGYQSAIVSLASGNTLRFSTIVLDSRASPAYSCLTLDSNATNTSTQGAHFNYYGNICITPLIALKQSDVYVPAADFAQSQYNLYPASVQFAAATSGGFNNLTFAQWKGYGLDTASITADPMFVNAAGSNYNLQSFSPAVDAVPLPASLLTASPSISTDDAGNPRLVGSAFDIGALEYQGTVSTSGWNITPVGGSPQSATVNQQFHSALLAKVTDSAGNPVVGTAVTFTVPVSAATASFSGSATDTALTDNTGVATSAALLAGGQSGSYTVTAATEGTAALASFSLTNSNPGVNAGMLSGSGTNSAASASLTSEGPSDWVHWGDSMLNRKNGVTALISNYTVVGSGSVISYNNDPRPLSWTDGAPAVTGSNNNGLYINSLGNGFSVTAPADASVRILTIHLGGWFSGATFTAHLSDASAPDFVDSTSSASGQYDRNYTLTYSAASPGKTLTLTWIMTSGSGNVTLNGAALQQSSPTLAPTAGTTQTTAVNTAFATLLQAIVKDANNTPLPGVTVTFTAPSNGPSASFSGSISTVVTTNSNGIAIAPALTANGLPGAYTVIASAAGVTATAAFSLANTSSHIGTGSLSGVGNSNSIPANLTFEGSSDWVHWGDNLLNRKNNVNPQIANYTIVGSGPLMSYNNDLRSLSWTDGNPAASGANNDGLYISFTQNGFSFTAPADTSTRILTVHVGGWYSAGTFTAHLSDGSARDFVDVTSPASGQYDRNYILTYTAASSAQSLNISWVMTSGNGNVTLNGAALSQSGPSISAAAGTPQSATINTAFGAALQASVKDASNNPLTGVIVTFTAPAAGAGASFSGSTTVTATTNASGIATAPTLTANSQVGTYTIAATAPGVSSSAAFNLANLAVVTPPTISATAGTPQIATINTTFGTAMQATVRDASNNPLSGVTVTFTAPATGASARFNGSATATATTSASGIATAPTLTANSQIGTYTIAATAPGVSGSAAFNLTNLAIVTLPTISATAGTPQTTTVNKAFGVLLQATVKDASNNPLSGITVTFTAPATGASSSFNGSATATATTNASGIATVPTLTANSQTGSYTIAATAPGVSGSAAFNLTNLAVVTPPSISAASGTPQTTTVNTAFGVLLQATVKDASNNPLSGVTVTFTAPATGAGASFNGSVTATASTNASGIATAPTLTANSQTGSYTIAATAPGVSGSAAFNLTNVAAGASKNISFIQQASGANLGNNQNTLTVALGSLPVISNQLVLIFDQVGASQTITSITGATWSRVSQNYTTNNGDSEIWVGSNPTSSTITITGSNYFGTFQPGYAIVAEFTGLSPTLDGSPILATGGIWPVATGSVTTTGADLLITATLTYNGGGVNSNISTPWTLLKPFAGTYSLSAAYQITTAPSSYSATWNGNGSPQVSTTALALKAAGAGSQN